MSSEASRVQEQGSDAARVGRLHIDPAAIEQRGEDWDGVDEDRHLEAAVRRRRAQRPRWLRITLWAMAACFGYYALNLIQVHLVAREDQARAVDAIVVMGAAQYDGRPSPVLQARLDHVVELWDDGFAPLVVVTGGNRPGDRFTEAEASRDYLVDHGVRPEVILSEDEGRSSWESLSAVAEMLDAVGAQSVLLVSDPYHMLRIRMMAEDLGLTAYVSPARENPLSTANEFGREVKEAAGVAVGRIIGFDRLLSITG